MSTRMDGKGRILTHMNADHALSLEDYLVVYGEVPVASIVNPQLEDITLTHMIISYSTPDTKAVSKQINFDPPLESLNDARSVLVSMARNAANKRGLSTSQVDKFVWPNLLSLDLPTLVGVLGTLGLALAPPALRNNILLKLAPILGTATTSFLNKYSAHAIGTVLAIHALETVILSKKIRKYRIPSPVNYYWYVSSLIEGIRAKRRLDSLISEAENH